MNLKNKKVLITGATGGIGFSLVEKFYNLGSTIIATGTNQLKLDELKQKYSNIHIENFKLDKHDQIENFIEKVDTKLNNLEITKLNNYTDAEDYHDNYYDNNPNQPYCLFVIRPKLNKLQRDGIID